MHPTFRTGKCVDLIDNDRVDGFEYRRGFGREHQIQRLWRGDQNVWGFSQLTVAFRLWCITRAHSDGNVGHVTPHTPGHPGDSGQRGAQVIFHIHPKGLERRDVEDAYSTVRRHTSALNRQCLLPSAFH